MGKLTITELDEALATSLRERADSHGRSMEEEARAILRAALAGASGGRETSSFGDAIRALVAPYGGFDLDLPPREPMREPPDFSA